MAEYLEREGLLRELRLWNLHKAEPDNFHYTELKAWLEALPAEDVQPVKHGEWTAEGNDEIGNYWDECTVCRRAVFFPPSVKNDYKYCPHCGAKMDGEDNG